MQHLFTSESVTEGHPDKIADQISDAILDAIITLDPQAKVACEVFTTTDYILIGGEVRTNVFVDYEQIARGVLKRIGYNNIDYGIDYQTCQVEVKIHEQSNEIFHGVEKSNGIIGAGDQGIMFGYATKEANNFMPYAIDYANKLAARLSKVRHDKIINYLRPDGKTQVTIEYNQSGSLKRIHTILISTQHDPNIDIQTIENDLKKNVIDQVIDPELIDEKTLIYINPSGSFIVGGPHGDAGLTGRKIIADTYGGSCAHGGGAFSGKDSTKVDRSAAYIARKIAKTIVCADLADKCQVQLAYAIGIDHPLSINIDTFKTNKIDEQLIINKINQNFDLTPSGIIKELDLQTPIFQKTTIYGHFGKGHLAWESLDKVNQFKI